MLILKGAVGKALEKGFLGLLLYFDGILYQTASWLYRLFYQLASVQLLSNEMYEAIANRVYLLVGVISLFVFTFLLLKALVDPDTLGKGLIKSFKSLVVSLLLLLLMPTIFTYIYSFQAAVFQESIIDKFFNFSLAEETESSHNIDTEVNYRNLTMSDYCSNSNTGTYNVGSTSVIVDDGVSTRKECEGNYLFLNVMEAFFEPEDSNVTNEYGTTWLEARKYIIYTGKFNYVKSFAEPLMEQDNITYLPLISGAAAFFLIYVTLSFCIDIGVRAAKLAFYQVIAPIPILMRVIPGKEAQYEKWQKTTVNTFIEVFTRIIILNFVMFMCKNIITIINELASNGNDIGMFGKAILILGLFMFAKQAPNLLQEAIGFEGGNLKLGIGNKVGDAALIGGALGNAVKKVEGIPGNVGKNIKGRVSNGASKLYGATSGAIGAMWGADIAGGDVNGVKAQNKAFNKALKDKFESSAEFTDIMNRRTLEAQATLASNKSAAIASATEEYNKAFDDLTNMDNTINSAKLDINNINKQMKDFEKSNSDIFKDAFGNKRSNDEIKRLLEANASAGNSSAKEYLESMGKIGEAKQNLAKYNAARSELVTAKLEANKKLNEAKNISTTLSSDEVQDIIKATREEIRTTSDSKLSEVAKKVKTLYNEDYYKNNSEYQDNLRMHKEVYDYGNKGK